MKNQIKLSALFLLLTTGLFATSAIAAESTGAKDEVTFSSLSADRGFKVKVEKSAFNKSIVMISDENSNVVMKDSMPGTATAEKGYVLTNLEDGDYTIEVISNKQVIQKHIHVYDEDQKKSYIFLD